MKNAKKLAGKLRSRMELPEEALPLQPILELCSDSRVLIENHAGICEYSLERIAVNVRFGQLIILGKDLYVRKMQGQVLVIQGRIEKISVERGRI